MLTNRKLIDKQKDFFYENVLFRLLFTRTKIIGGKSTKQIESRDGKVYFYKKNFFSIPAPLHPLGRLWRIRKKRMKELG